MSRADLDYVDQHAAEPKTISSKWVRPQISPEILSEVLQAFQESQRPEAVEFRRVAALPRQDRPVVAMAFSADASRLATCTEDGDCRVWKLPSADQEHKLQKKIDGNVVYSFLAMHMSSYYGPADLFKTEKFDYARIRAGLQELSKQFPDNGCWCVCPPLGR